MSEKVLVVTGAASGLGLASAVKFAQKGYNIGLLDIDENGGKHAEEKIKSMGRKAVFCKCDISDSEQVNTATDNIISGLDRVDVLHNNAGIEVRGSILQCTEQDWIKLYEVNLKGLYYMSQAFIPYIIKQGEGAVINTGSILGFRSVPERAAYSSSKGAIDTLSRSMAMDLAEKNIRVNCVVPGAIDTPLLRGSINDSPDPAETEGILNRKSLFNRMGTPEEVANVVYFLASDEASFVTGATYFVDGGWSVL